MTAPALPHPGSQRAGAGEGHRHPYGAGAVTLALLFGLFNLVYGTWQLVLGIDLRHTDKALHPVHGDRHPHRISA